MTSHVSSWWDIQILASRPLLFQGTSWHHQFRCFYSKVARSALSRASGSLCGGLWPPDDGGGDHLPGMAPPAGLLPQVQCGPGVVYLASHRKVQHGVYRGALSGTYPHPLDDPRTYHIPFLRTAGYITCPVGGFLGRATIHSALWVHFVHLHMR